MNFTHELPLVLCDESLAINYVQGALRDFYGYGLDVDRKSGKATQTAARTY